MLPSDFKTGISNSIGGYPYLTKIYQKILDNIQRATWRIWKFD